MKTYIFTYIGSLVMSLILTPAIIALAKRYELFDRTEERKVHSGRIARIGGLAIIISMICMVGAVYLLPNKVGESFRQISVQILAMLGGAILVFATGLIDDIKAVKTWIKLLTQTIAAVLVCIFGIRIEVINIPDLLSLKFGILSWPFTILWIVGVTNAVNFIDGLDGLAARRRPASEDDFHFLFCN